MTTKQWQEYLDGCPHGGPLTEKEWEMRFRALAAAGLLKKAAS